MAEFAALREQIMTQVEQTTFAAGGAGDSEEIPAIRPAAIR
jgi:hypothetical protein